MTQKSIPLFVNPAAGRGRAGRRLPTIENLLREGGLDIDVRSSTTAGEMSMMGATVPNTGISING